MYQNYAAYKGIGSTLPSLIFSSIPDNEEAALARHLGGGGKLKKKKAEPTKLTNKPRKGRGKRGRTRKRRSRR